MIGVVAADSDLLAEGAGRVVAAVVADGDLRGIAGGYLVVWITGGGAAAVSIDIEDEKGFVACVDKLELHCLYEVETEGAKALRSLGKFYGGASGKSGQHCAKKCAQC